MRYFLIDKILFLKRDSNIIALKNAALSEDIYSDHFYGNPIMPGALQIESMAQAGTALLEMSSGFKRKALLILVSNAKFRELVRPGDQIKIEMKIQSYENDLAQMDGTINVGEKLVTTARLVFALHRLDDYYHPEIQPLIHMLYDTLLRDATLVDIDYPGASK